MGFAYNDLIPAAILLDNPGINREEFVALLNNTRSSSVVFKEDYEKKIRRARWDTYYPKWETKLYHRGLHGLAELLYLEKNPAFKKFQQSKNDQYGLKLNPLFLIVVPYKVNNKWQPPKFKVVVHEKHALSKIHEVHEKSWNKLEKGELFTDPYYNMSLMLMEEILGEKHIPSQEKQKTDDEEDHSPEWEYHLKVRYVSPLEKTRRFASLDELVKSYPEFHHDFMYDFSQNEGFLYSDFLQLGTFIWKQQAGKYFLHEETFNRIPVGMGEGPWKGYTDLIMTAEAIKHQAWKFLAYCGRRYLLDLFLKKFPDSAARRERAVWDAYTSLMAKKLKMSHTEFLRWRLLK